jgi:two-component system nitrogen regulation sensor histidine kinase GlnL
MTPTGSRLEAVFHSLQVGVLVIDAKGRTEFQNAEASRILGVSASMTHGHRLEGILGADHPVPPLLADTLLNERDVSVHACPLPERLGGEARVVDLASAPLRIGGEIDGAVLTLRDHTIGRELESLVDQRARSELFAQLASGIAHEIRNPLGGIRGAAELLQGKLEEDRLRRYPELIRNETDRILRLLDDLAQLTHGGDLRRQLVNLHAVLDNLLELQCRAPAWRGIQIHREYDPSIPELQMDPDRITQVFLNLIRNAVEAMDRTGQIILRTRMEAEFQLSPDEERPGRMVRVDVEDSGPGIPEEDLPHVFTPFFTRRDRGTGLGLAVAQHWVVRHGGRIQVFNLRTQGARVRVQLPVPRNP